MNGLAVTIIVGQLPKLFGFSTDADGFFEEIRAFLEGLDQTNTTALAIGLATLAVLLLLPRVTKKVPAVLVAVLGRHRGDRRSWTWRPRAWTWSAAAPGVAEPDLPVGSARVPGTAPGRVLRHRARLPDRPDRHLGELRRARGENVDANQEMVGMGGSNIVAGHVPGLRGVGQWFAHCRRRAVGGEVPGHWPGRRGRRGAHAAAVPHPPAEPPPARAGRRGDRGRPLAARRADPRGRTTACGSPPS